jgi:cobalt/nickel transport system permease protein
MHIPDGFLDARTAIAAAAVSATAIAIALPAVRRQLPPSKVPLLGLTAAFVFAAQMLNFPVGGGTSGHLVGGVLVTALLGTAAAIVVMTAVLLTQCLLFADGGITALGANLCNMGVLTPIAGGLLLAAVQRCSPGPRGRVLGAAFAGWASVVLASISCAGQLALAGTATWSAALPAMVSVHAVIGIGEGAITALVLAALLRARPDLLAVAAPVRELRTSLCLGGVATAGLAVFVAPFASPLPDGLEQVGQALGLPMPVHAAAPLTDYSVVGISSPTLAAASAAMIGVVVAFALSWLLARALVPIEADFEADLEADGA